MFYLTLIVLLPIAALILKTTDAGFIRFWEVVTSPRALASFRITIGAALMATAFSAVYGLLMAWILTRYRFPGRRILDALMDLPFALPTSVAGIALTALFAGNGWFGRFLEPAGFPVAYTIAGVAVAMAFTSVPFVVRTVQPVIEELKPELEESAATLGAWQWQIGRYLQRHRLVPACGLSAQGAGQLQYQQRVGGGAVAPESALAGLGLGAGLGQGLDALGPGRRDRPRHGHGLAVVDSSQ